MPRYPSGDFDSSAGGGDLLHSAQQSRHVLLGTEWSEAGAHGARGKRSEGTVGLGCTVEPYAHGDSVFPVQSVSWNKPAVAFIPCETKVP